MKYGNLNLAIIAPDTSIPLAERIRPPWLCITAPEHSQRGISEKDSPDLTPEQIAEAEAQEARRQTIRAIKKQAAIEERRRISAEKQLARDAEREAASRARQEARKAEHVPTIGESIFAFRKEYNLTRIQLAKTLGCSMQTIYEWEKGKFTPWPGMIEQIAVLDQKLKEATNARD